MARPAHKPSRLLADLSRATDDTSAQVVVAPDRPDPPGTDLCDAVTWRRFVHSLSDEESLSVGRGMLARSGFLSASGTSITVGFYSNHTLRNAIIELEDDALQAAITEHFGDGVTLDPVLDDDGVSGRSLAEELDRLRAIKTEELRQAALAHPAVTTAQRVFQGATIIGEPRIPPIEEIAHVD